MRLHDLAPFRVSEGRPDRGGDEVELGIDPERLRVVAEVGLEHVEERLGRRHLDQVAADQVQAEAAANDFQTLGSG